MERPDNLELKKKYLAVNFIGLAMIGSVFIYAVLVEVFRRYYTPFPGQRPLAPETVDLLRYLLLAVAVMHFFLIKTYQKKSLSPSTPNLPGIAIITFCFCESPAILGLVLFFLSGNHIDYYIFMVISLFYFYLFFPRYDQWEKVLGSKPPSGT